MNKPLGPPLVDDDAFDEPADAHPHVFVRAFSVPAAMPWEQTRAAQLEARHGAPLPISELLFRCRRLGSWGLGRPGRFAVFYVRGREFKAPFETVVEVDGEPVKVAFGAGAEQLRRAKSSVLVLILVGFTAFVLAAAPMIAFKARRDAQTRLDAVEQALAAKMRLAAAVERDRRNAGALRRAIGRTAPVGDVLADLAWATRAKDPEARIVAIHWDHGFLAVEARGEVPPFNAGDRRLERSDKPVRAGVWLWGVHPDLGLEGDIEGMAR